MKIKKNPKFNEDKNRVVYFQLGLFITSATMLMAFSWKAPKVKHFNFNDERVAEIPKDSVYIEKIEYPEVKPIVKKAEEPQVDDITQEIKQVENKDKKEKTAVDLAPTDIDIDDEVLEGDGISGGTGIDVIEEYPDELASFPGNFTQFLKSRITYPEISIQFNEEGIVYVGFIVEKNGDLNNFRIIEGSAKSPDLQDEALKVVKQSPNWEPAIKNGEKVRSQVKVPVRFKLNK